MGKYIEKEILLELVSQAVDDIEKTVDDEIAKGPNSDIFQTINEAKEKIVEMGVLGDTNDLDSISAIEALCGTGLLNVAFNIMKSSPHLIVNPNFKRRIVMESDGMRVVSDKVPETEIMQNVQNGIDDIERFLNDISSGASSSDIV